MDRTATRTGPRRDEGSSIRTPRHHATSDVHFDGEQAEFLRAIEEFQRISGKKFPTWTDALSVLKRLGWIKPLSWEEVQAREALHAL